MKHADHETKRHRALASAWEVKLVEHRLNFVRMIHTNNVAAVEESLIENESDPPLSTSISDLEKMAGFTQEANLEDVALLTKAEMHLDHVESAVAICCRAKQQHEQGGPVVYDPTDLGGDIQIYNEFKDEHAELNSKVFT